MDRRRVSALFLLTVIFTFLHGCFGQGFFDLVHSLQDTHNNNRALYFEKEEVRLRDSWLNLEGFELKTFDWPKLDSSFDYDDSLHPSQRHFYFNNEAILIKPKWVSLQLNQTLLQRFRNHHKLLTVTFKIWIFPKENLTETGPIWLTFGENEEDKFDIFKRYHQIYDGYWMPVTVRFNSRQLAFFRIFYQSGSFFFAFKDFKVKYEELTEVRKPKPIESNIPSICVPAKHDFNLSGLIYFPVCDQKTKCLIRVKDSSMIDLNNDLDTFKIQFETWFTNPTFLLINGAKIESSVIEVQKELNFTFSNPDPHSCLSLGVRIKSIESIKTNETLCDDALKCQDKLSIIGNFADISKVYHSKTSQSESYHYLRASNLQNRVLYLESFPRDSSIDELCLRLEFFKFQSNQVYDFDVFYQIQSNPMIVLTSSSVFLDHERMKFCFADYLRFQSRNFSLGIQIRTRLVVDPLPPNEPIWLIFKHSFSKETNRDDEQPVRKFLYSAEDNWNLNEVEDQENLFNFEPDSKLIVFKDECDRELNFSKTIGLREARFSTVWLNGSGRATANWIYSISSTAEEIQIAPKLCDQLGQCHYLYQEHISEFDDDESYNYFRFEFEPLPLYRLEFVFQYNLLCDLINSRELKLNFKPVYFGDPCQEPNFGLNRLIPSINCHHEAQCYVDLNGQPKCDCPEEYLGKTCQNDNFCVQNNGTEICSKLVNLDCINLVDGFQCACTNNLSNEFIWDSTELKCVSKNGIFLSEFNDYPITLVAKNQKRGELLISYHFEAKDLTTGYDLCFNLNASRDSTDAQIQVKFESLDNDPNSVSLSLSRFNLGTEEDFEFCLYRDYFGQLYWLWQRNYRIWWNTFELNFYLAEKSTETLKINFVKFKLENLDKLNFTYDVDYEQYFEENINFNKWYPTNENLDPGFLVQRGSINDSIQFSSDWFSYPAFSDSFDLVFKKINSNDCILKMVILRVVYANMAAQLFENALNSEKIGDNKFRFTGLEPKTKRFGIFKLIFELQTTCTLVQLDRLGFEKPCAKHECGEHGHCQSDWTKLSARCRCDSGYFGETCQWKSPCTEKSISDKCDSALSEHNSPSQCEFDVNATNHYTCRCLTSQFEWNLKTLSCEMKSQFETISVTNSLVDVSDFHWMNQNAYYELSHHFGDSSDVFFSLFGSHPKMTIDFFSVESLLELCLVLKVWRSSSSISYGVSVNDDMPLYLDSDTNGTQLCLDTLDDTVNFGWRFHIEANITKPAQMFALSFKDIKLVDPVNFRHEHLPLNYVPNLHYFDSTWKKSKTQLLKTFWPLIFPEEAWSPSDFTFVYKSSSEKRTAYLLSVIIENPMDSLSNGLMHRFRFQYTLPVNVTANLTITPVVFNAEMRQLDWKTENITKVNQTTKYLIYGNFEIERGRRLTSVDFRVGFKIEDSGHTESTFDVAFFNLDLDDFCIMNTSYAKQGCGNGFCKVDLTKNQGYHCQCQLGFQGDTCESKNLCYFRENDTSFTGEEVCQRFQAGRCVNQRNHFTCDCDNLKFWDNKDKKCKEFPEILTISCQNNRVLNQTTGRCECNLKEGYVENKQADCVKLDPCTEFQDHCPKDSQCWSDFIGLKPVEPVSHSSCVCKDGFTSTSEGESCKVSSICGSPFRNPCEQICNESNGATCSCTTGYTLTKSGTCVWTHDNSSTWQQCKFIPNSYFDLKSQKCLCRTGFTMSTNYLNSGRDVCVPIGKLDQLSDCPCHLGKIEINKNAINFGEVRCECLNSKLKLPFEQDQSGTCQVGSICTECDQQNALCALGLPESLQKETQKPYYCVCPPGQHREANSQICIDHCQDPSLVAECAKIGATCNPLAKLTENLVNSSIQHEWSDLCRCEGGLLPEYRNSKLQNCTIQHNVYGLNLKLNVTTYLLTQTYQTNANYDQVFVEFLRNKHLNLNPIKSLLSRYSKDLSSENMNQLLHQYYLSMVKNRLLIEKQITSMQIHYAQREFNSFIQKWKLKPITWIQLDSCQTIDSGYYDCSLWFQLESKNYSYAQKWTSSLVDGCHSLPNDHNCFIEFDNSTDLQFLIFNKPQMDKVEVKEMKPCEQLKVCDRYPGTVCHDKHDSPTCECAKCKDPTLISSNTTTNDSGFKASNCKVDPTRVCKYCPSNDHHYNGTCSIVEFKAITIKINCKCNSKFVSENSNQLLLNGTTEKPISIYQTNICFDPCANLHCSSHGECMWDGNFKPFCSCYGDWEGNLCDVQHESKEAEVTKVIIVILSIVGSIIVLLILCLFIIWIKSNVVCRVTAKVESSRRFSFEMSSKGTYHKTTYEESMNTKKKELRKSEISAPMIVNTSYSINMAETRLEQNQSQQQQKEEQRNKPSTSKQVSHSGIRVKVLPDPPLARARTPSTDFSDTSSNISLPPSKPPSPVPKYRKQESSSSNDSTRVVLTRANLKKRINS